MTISSIGEQFRLDDKVAIVTGARTGLGKSMAIGLAEAGADIVGVSRNDMTELSDAIEELDRRFLGIRADLSTTEPVDEVLRATQEAFMRVDILINNAGVVNPADTLKVDEEQWDETESLNAKVPFFLSQAAAKLMIEQGDGGKIINLASMRSFSGGSNSAAYTTSKIAILGITRTLARRFGEFGIQCNAIAPGFMKTNMTEDLWSDPANSQRILDRTPANRWGKPDDLKGAVVFLASPASAFVNGHTLCVDGGYLTT